MTFTDLRKYAENNGIAIKKTMDKTAILKAVLAHDFGKMTVSELKSVAKEMEIPIPSKAKKADIIEVLFNENFSSITGKASSNSNKSLITSPGRTTLKKQVGTGDYILNVCTICQKCGEGVHGVCLTVSDVDTHKQHPELIKLFAKCPNCGNVLGLKDELCVEYYGTSGLDSAFETLKEKITAENRSHSVQSTDQYIESLQIPEEKSSNNTTTKNILSSTDNLKRYILYLIHIESEVYFLKERLATLQLQADDNQKSAFRASKMIDSDANAELLSRTYELKAEIEELEYEIAHPRDFIDSNALVISQELQTDIKKPERSLPQRPTKPCPPKTPKPVRPSEPIYKKTGLFNKRKVQIENEQLKADYEAKMTHYTTLLHQYEEEESCYLTALKDYERQNATYTHKEKKYKAALKQYEAALKKSQDEAYGEALKAAEDDFICRKKQILKEKKAEYKTCKSSVTAAAKERLKLIPQLEIERLITNEQERAREELKEIITTRNEIYSYNVIYGKYRNHVALTTIYEYLDSGRCATLDGSQGAYNLYESESRTNEIIVQLSTIAASLETIKGNQLMLYRELKQANHNLDMLNASMNEAISEITNLNATMQEVNANLSYISEQLSDIDSTAQDIRAASAVTAVASVATTHNTAVTAYHAAVTAHYSKVNAELTNALGFLIAMK